MYKRKVRGWSQHIDFMLLDDLCVFVSILLGFLLAGKQDVLSSRFFWWMVLEAVLVNQVVMIVIDTYHSVLHHSPWDELVLLFTQTGYVVLILLVFQLLSQTSETNLTKIALYAILLYLVFCYIVRQVYKGYLKKKHHIFNRHSLLIALETSQIPTVIPRILRANYGVYRFTGIAIMGANPSETDAMQALRQLWDEYPDVETIPIVATAYHYPYCAYTSG